MSYLVRHSYDDLSVLLQWFDLRLNSLRKTINTELLLKIVPGFTQSLPKIYKTFFRLTW